MTPDAISGVASSPDRAAARSSTREWVHRYLEALLETGFDLTLSDADGGAVETVCILETRRFAFHAPVEVLPSWIDPEAEFPVEADPA